MSKNFYILSHFRCCVSKLNFFRHYELCWTEYFCSSYIERNFLWWANPPSHLPVFAHKDWPRQWHNVTTRSKGLMCSWKKETLIPPDTSKAFNTTAVHWFIRLVPPLLELTMKKFHWIIDKLSLTMKEVCMVLINKYVWQHDTVIVPLLFWNNPS